MAFLDETQSVERLQFFDGMRLFAPDLQGLEALNREMRWLHNRSLHQPGIGNGYAVRGQKGDRDVRIGPGYALDDLGREIVLTREVIQAVPPEAGEEDGKPVTYDLAVSYPEDEFLDVVETRAGVCAQRKATRLREQPRFEWIALRRTEEGVLIAETAALGYDVQRGRRVIVARVEILQCKLHALSLTERRSARPSCRPHIAAGREEEPAWDVQALLEFPEPAAPAGPPPEPAPAAPVAGAAAAFATTAPIGLGALQPFTLLLPIGLTCPVDTRAAGFRTTPHYTARLKGQRAFVEVRKVEERDIIFAMVMDGQVSVRDADVNGFHADVIVLLSATRDVLTALLHALRLEDFKKAFLPFFSAWQIEWMGVENG